MRAARYTCGDEHEQARLRFGCEWPVIDGQRRSNPLVTQLRVTSAVTTTATDEQSVGRPAGRSVGRLVGQGAHHLTTTDVTPALSVALAAPRFCLWSQSLHSALRRCPSAPRCLAHLGMNLCTSQCTIKRRAVFRNLQRWSKNLLVLIGVEQVAEQIADLSSVKTASAAAGATVIPGPLRPPHVGLPNDWNPEDSCFFCWQRMKEVLTSDNPSADSRSGKTPDDTKAMLSDSLATPQAFDVEKSTDDRSTPAAEVAAVSADQLYFDHLLREWQKMAICSFLPLHQFYSTPYLQSKTTAGAVPQAFLNGVPSATTGQAMTAATLPDDQPLDLTVKSSRNAHRSQVKEVKPCQSIIPAFSSSSSNHVNKRNYSKADLEAAVLDIRSGKLGTRRASVIYGVPRSTLRNKIYKLEASGNRNDRKRHRTTEPTNETNYGQSSPAVVQPTTTPAYEKQLQVSSPNDHGRLTLQELTLNLAKTQAQMLHLDQDHKEKLKWDAENRLSSAMNSECVSIMVQNASKIALIQMFEQKARDSISNFVDIIGDQQQQQQQQQLLLQQRTGGDDTPKAAYKTCVGQTGATATADSVCKKSRPKRGQYRKYDKNALAQAVQSVRRGEMSVHRAGSYYGVPHSTLEYKVKERNLIKGRKRQQSMSVDSSSSSDMQTLADDKTTGEGTTLMAESLCMSKSNSTLGTPQPVDEPMTDSAEETRTDVCDQPQQPMAIVKEIVKTKKKKSIPRKVTVDENVNSLLLDVDSDEQQCFEIHKDYGSDMMVGEYESKTN